MSSFPTRPKLGPLHRRARELLCAATSKPVAVGCTAVISNRLVLSSVRPAVAREHGFDNWTAMAHYVRLAGPDDLERALLLADAAALSALLDADAASVTTKIGGLVPLLVLLRRSTGSAIDIRRCARLLLDAGADPNSFARERGGLSRRSALLYAVQRRDLELIRLLIERGATRDDEAAEALLAGDGVSR